MIQKGMFFKAHTELSILTSEYWEKIEMLIENGTRCAEARAAAMGIEKHVLVDFFLNHSREL